MAIIAIAIATTIKIPNPIPALNIPVITSQELKNVINNGRIKRSVFDGFIAIILGELILCIIHESLNLLSLNPL